MVLLLERQFGNNLLFATFVVESFVQMIHGTWNSTHIKWLNITFCLCSVLNADDDTDEDLTNEPPLEAIQQQTADITRFVLVSETDLY